MSSASQPYSRSPEPSGSTASTPGFGQVSSGPTTPQGASADMHKTADSIKAQGAKLVDDAKHTASEASTIAAEKISDATAKIKASGHYYLQQKKQLASNELGVVRDAINKAADKLRQEDHPEVASYVAAAAEQLDRLREVIDRRGVGELAKDARRLTRQHPEIVYGGLFVAGLAMMRFLKASHHDDDYQSSMGARPLSRRPSNQGPSPYSVNTQWPPSGSSPSRPGQSTPVSSSSTGAAGTAHVSSAQSALATNQNSGRGQGMASPFAKDVESSSASVDDIGVGAPFDPTQGRSLPSDQTKNNS